MRDLSILIASLTLWVGGATYALEIQAAPSQPTDQINLYENPNQGSKILTTLNLKQNLIPIFQQKEWVKVGNPQNGQIGWINIQQYNKVMEQTYKPDVQMIMVQQEQNTEGKPSYNVVAYKNGKKLTDEEAKALYQRMMDSQVKIDQQIQQYQSNLNKWLNREVTNFNFPFSHFGMPFFPQPIIVINQSTTQAKVNKP